MNKIEFNEILAKAAAGNPLFREKLLKNPRKVLESVLKNKLPDNLQISVHEDTPNRLNIILPVQTGELNTADLDAVTGGLNLLNLDSLDNLSNLNKLNKLDNLLSDKELLLL